MKKYLLILIIILLLATFFRLWQIESIPPGLYPDEAINGNEALSKAGKVFYPENNGREGLFINLIFLSFSIFGASIWSLKLVSAIAGILTVLGIYLLTRELLKIVEANPTAKKSVSQAERAGFKRAKRGRERGREPNSDFLAGKIDCVFSWGGVRFQEIVPLLASFFLAISFWHVNFSRIGFRAILIPLILTFSFYFLFKGFRIKKNNNFVFSGIIFGLGFYTYTAFRLAVILLFLVLVLWWFIYKKQNLQKKFILYTLYFILLIFITALPLGVYFLANPGDFIGRASGVSIFNTGNPLLSFGKSLIIHLGMFNFSGDFNWRHNFSGSPILFWPIGILFLIGLVLSIKKIVISLKQKKWLIVAGYWLLVFWFFILLLPAVLTIEAIPHSLRVIGTIPVVYIFAAIGGYWLYNLLSKIMTKKTLLIFSILILIIFTLNQFDKYFFEWAKRPETEGAFAKNYVNIGNYLNSLASDTQKYVIVNQSGVSVEGIPMPAQTVMFIEATSDKRQATRYILPNELNQIKIKKETIIVPLLGDLEIYKKLKNLFPEGKIKSGQGFWSYKVNF